MLRFSSRHFLRSLSCGSQSISIQKTYQSVSTRSVKITALRKYFLIKLCNASNGYIAYHSSLNVLKNMIPMFERSIFSLPQRYFTVTHFNESNSNIFKPAIDMKYVIEHRVEIQASIDARGLIGSVEKLEEKYEKVKQWKKELETLETEKNAISKLYADLVNRTDLTFKIELEPEYNFLLIRGRLVRDKIRTVTSNINEVGEMLVDALLELPNVLDIETPLKNRVLKKQNITPDSLWPLEFSEYVTYQVAEYSEPKKIGSVKSYEIPMSHSAAQETELSVLSQNHLINAGFSEIGAFEDVRRTIIHSLSEKSDEILQTPKDGSLKKASSTSYFTDSLNVPSMLLLHAQSLLENEIGLPLRHFFIGRSHNINREKVANHNCVVQCLIAAHNRKSMEEEFQNLADQMENFYSHEVGIPKFQIQVVPATQLSLFQSKKYAFVMASSEKYPSRFLGEISTIGDYLSKRLLCCYKDKHGDAQFLHLVHATFFNVSHFLRITQSAQPSSAVETPSTEKTPSRSAKP